jgi:hypothetical protein
MQEYDKSGSSSTMKLVEIFKSFMDRGKWGYTMLRSLIQNEKEELCIIESVLEFVLIGGSGHAMYSSFRLLLQMLYDADLLTDEVLVEWASSVDEEQTVSDFDDEKKRRHPAVTTEARKSLMMEPQLQEFIEWLQDDDDESDDDDDSDEDSD